MKLLLSILFFSSSLMKYSRADETQKLNVTIFYESLCPDSQSFIQNQLYKNYDELKDKISLTFIPFGKSKV
jgi:interferon gamma-inducible protein 30